MFKLLQRPAPEKPPKAPPEFQWMKLRMDYSLWVLTAGTTAACSILLWIGQTLHSLQLDSTANRIKNTTQDNSISLLLRREEINRALLETIVTKLSVLEYRIK